MLDVLTQPNFSLLAATLLDVLSGIKSYGLIFIGFSAVIFVHELGHFLVAKWADVRVEKFCIGFGRELFGFTRGETRYGFNILPLGGYVKMMGQEDFEVDTTGDLQARDDPRSFANKAVLPRMAIVSAGVIMNVIFAALLFMIVFMVGMEAWVTEVGFVKPGSPAALGGLQVGDEVVAIDGQEIKEFKEVNMAIMLADPHTPLDFTVMRDGKPKHLKILPENSEDRGLLAVGMGPAVTREIGATMPGGDPNREDLPRVGDKIVEIDGVEVNDDNANEMFFRIVNDPGRDSRVVVERPVDPDDPQSANKRVAVEILPSLQLEPGDPFDPNSISVLGFAPLMRFDVVEPEGRAGVAGIQMGDTVIRVGDVEYPTRNQIHKTILDACKVTTGVGPNDFDYAERDIPIVVQRGDAGDRVELTLRPKVRRHLIKRNGRPDIGATYDRIADDLLRVGEIVPQVCGVATPAAVANIPAGALITRVNDAEVKTWIELIEAFRGQAGQTVSVAYTAAGTPATAEMRVPHSLRTTLGLPVVSQILTVDGAETIKVTLKGKQRPLSVSNWYGLRHKLAECVGRTVTVEYRSGFLGEVQSAEVAVTEDMIDPWVGRATYRPNVQTLQARKMLRTLNPIEAVAIGVKKTGYFIVNVYVTFKRMIFTRSVGVEHLSGPVGIVKLGSDVANVGLVQLIFFLAMISANLAVINFLPLPIVDGGLMVFLIIEKIKGTPVSIKMQVATQVVGLFLIIAAFLFVTYQDLMRLWG